MTKRKGGRLTGVPLTTKLTGPVAIRSVADAKAIGNLLHGLFVHNHSAQRFAPSVRILDRLNKIVLIIHDRLPAKLSSNFSLRKRQYGISGNAAPKAKRVFHPKKHWANGQRDENHTCSWNRCKVRNGEKNL